MNIAEKKNSITKEEIANLIPDVKELERQMNILLQDYNKKSPFKMEVLQLDISNTYNEVTIRFKTKPEVIAIDDNRIHPFYRGRCGNFCIFTPEFLLGQLLQ